ncbi:MAG: AAA family ATPase [Planctomycetaceae bacterium]
MYETNFGFHRQPFQCADLTRAFFISESIRTILPQLLHALRSDLGIAVLTGPAGVGKTSLLKHLQIQLAHEGRAILCSGAGLETPGEVLQTLQAASLLRAGEGSSESASTITVRSRWTVIEQMRKTTEFWGPILLLVDDAQLLSVPVLNELRAFTEEEWNGRALVRCLIAGPLNLEEELARPAHADFSRRVRCHAFLEPLSSKESLECLNRHLSVVGGKLKDVFSAQALDLIAVASDGLPRCLTLLADESLVVAVERSSKVADEDCVRTALTRLQHLAYAWNTSPMVSDHLGDLSESSYEFPARSNMAETTHVASRVTHIASGVFEFGVPGAIEFGAGPSSRTVFSQTTSQSVESAEVEISQLPRSNGPARDISPQVVRQASPAIFEAGFRENQSFEVGHRYQPDALEAIDAIEMDDFANITPENTEPALREKFDELSEEGLYQNITKEVDATEDLSTSTSPVASDADHKQLDADGQASYPDSTKLKTHIAIPSHTVHFPSNISEAVNPPVSSAIRVDTQEQMIRSAMGTDLSSRLPVFDRYTWIALGREVPPGAYAVSSASDMRRVTDNEFGEHDEWLTKDSAQNALTFDRIPVSRASDPEVMLLLKSHLSETERGDFVTYRPANVFGQSASTMEMPGNNNPAVAIHSQPPAPMPDVTQNPQQIDAFESLDDNVISDANRQVIQNAIRSSLLASLAESASAIPSVDAFDVTDSFATLNASLTPGYPGITEQFQVNGWHDGQLIFNSQPADETENALPTPTTEASSEPEQVSLNFEAARLARNGLPSTDRNNTGSSNREPDRSAPKFFSLPDEVRTLEWDLRGDTLSTDDAGPLADTLASLRDEVTRFQQTGRASLPGDAATLQTPYGYEDRNSDGSLESLVSTARNRLESLSAVEPVLPAVIGTSTDAAILTQPVAQTSTAEKGIMPAESAVLPEATSSPADNRSPAGAAETSDFSPRYSQLFTKLRQVRSRVAGNR